jgi:hypothetical protein
LRKRCGGAEAGGHWLQRSTLPSDNEALSRYKSGREAAGSNDRGKLRIALVKNNIETRVGKRVTDSSADNGLAFAVFSAIPRRNLPARSAGRVADAMNDDLVRFHPIENQVRMRVHNDPAKVALTD